jgi:endoglucanase
MSARGSEQFDRHQQEGIMASFSRRNFFRRSVVGAVGTAAFGGTAGPQTPSMTEVTPLSSGSFSAGPAPIRLNEKEYFSAPGFSFLIFHNNYQVGFQGGLQMIQNGERILDSGGFYIVPKSKRQNVQHRVLRRVVDGARSTATVAGEAAAGEWTVGYQLACQSTGQAISVKLKLDSPLDWVRTQEAGLRIYIYPGAYFSKSYQSLDTSGIFPRQFTGQWALADKTPSLVIAQEDAALRFAVKRAGGGVLRLLDNRVLSPQTWFSIEAPVPNRSAEREVEIVITPSILPNWKKTPVIGISQSGYHPKQIKRAVIELGPDDDASGEVQLLRLRADGRMTLAKADACQAWGKFLRYQYTTFDFTSVTEPGLYKLTFRGQQTGPFPIHPGVYNEVWQPTLEYFLPIQMCHVKVQEGVRTWHGACHLDDALQAPAHLNHIDGYRQGDPATRFRDNQHIPGLDWGGWHDAGDHDLPAGSMAMTTLALALAQEEFSPAIDQTTIRRDARLVLLHVPDGHNDLFQQIEYGAESLLASYRVAGHIFSGVIESNRTAYAHVGDPVDITDNRVYDPKLKAGETDCNRSGNFDDRWAFTNRNTGLQYEVAQTLAAAGRVLHGYQNGLADECLETARKLWEFEQTHPPVYWRCGYNPGDSGFRSQEISATAELLITTQDEAYRKHLVDLLPVIGSISGEQFGQGPGFTLVRALPHVKDEGCHAAIRRLAIEWRAEADRRAASNPYGVRYPKEVSNPSWKLEKRTAIDSSFVWGSGWDLQWDALRQFYFHKHLPEDFGPEPLFQVVSFVLGCHPATNESFVSGVGQNSEPVGYGFNRADWSYIPGGVFSGCSLVKPDFMELKNFPFLWYQREYVIHGAATFIFIALAADKLLNG